MSNTTLLPLDCPDSNLVQRFNGIVSADSAEAFVIVILIVLSVSWLARSFLQTARRLSLFFFVEELAPTNL